MNHRIPLLAALSVTALISTSAQAVLNPDAVAPAKAAIKAPSRSISFVPTSLIVGQSARVSLVNLIPPDPVIPPDPIACSVQVNFYNANGQVVGDTLRYDLMPGQATSAAAPTDIAVPPVTFADTNGSAQPVLVRAMVQTVSATGKPQLPPDPCRTLHASLEVYDTTTQQTQLLNPGVIHGFNPQPDPPG